ncbi:MAG: T9SS type A sorting domain-containing protein [Bacteroidetes bacterium]|nr:T9SS type A sorting domain-containing protein [Bacteroidota bacterium]
MKRQLLLLLVALTVVAMGAFAQDYQRKVVDVPKVDPTAITIDGVMDEAAWNTAARANLVTSTGFDMFAYYYGRELAEPDFDEYVGRMLWAQDTLFVFIHIDEMVNDSTDLYWRGKWSADQLFVSISSRLGIDMKGWYDGNVYAAPDGPYHFLILADSVTLNNTEVTGIPDEFMRFPEDTQRVFQASDVARWGIAINPTTGVWDVEMAIYNPHIAAGSSIGFNIGGSVGSTKGFEADSDAYAYYTWQPSVIDSPYAQPPNVPIPSWGTDPGSYNLATSVTWAILQFTPGMDDLYLRRQVDVPRVAPEAITSDGQMTEPEWTDAATAEMASPTGFDMFAYYYGRELAEPDFDELTGRLLWSKETLYVFMHIDEIVNDSTDLYWRGKWSADQLFISLSNRLGIDMKGWYDGNVYAAPDGPYHFLVLADSVTLNNTEVTGIPDEFMLTETDTQRVFYASDVARSAITINPTTGVWDVEMAIYNPNVNLGTRIGFNVGGSVGSTYAFDADSDAYAYWTWQPSVLDSPYAQPPNVPVPSWGTDPGSYNLATSVTWAVLNFKATTGPSDVSDMGTGIPAAYALSQNYPNPFNPSTRIRFALPQSGLVTLTVHNLLGQEVARLANEVRAAGSHEVSWNAKNLATGLYFYRLKVDNRVIETKKMVLLK